MGFSQVALIAFDLDNTLYDEQLYYDAAFKEIAPMLSAECGVDSSAIEARLLTTLKARGKHYHQLFNDILRELELDENALLGEILEIFQTVPAQLTLFPNAREILVDLSERYRLGMITGGMRKAQQNKIRLLRIEGFFGQILYSSTLKEGKPSQHPFQCLLQLMHVAPERAIYVGDNPITDFKGARELGMLTIRVRNSEFDAVDAPPEHDAEVRIENLGALRQILLRPA